MLESLQPPRHRPTHTLRLMHMMMMPGSLQSLRTHALRNGRRPCPQRTPRRNPKHARPTRTVSLQGALVTSSWTCPRLRLRCSYLPVLLLHLVEPLITCIHLEGSRALIGHLGLVVLEEVKKDTSNLHIYDHLRRQTT